MNENGNNENEGPAAAGAGGAAAAANYNMKPAKKLKTRKNRYTRNPSGNLVLIGKKGKTMSLGASSKNKATKESKTRKAKRLQNGRDAEEQVYKKIDIYRKEAQAIYDKDLPVPTLDTAKKLLAITEKLYQRMPTAKLKEIVEVEISISGIAENILESFNKILIELEEKTKTTNAHNVDELARLLTGFGFK